MSKDLLYALGEAEANMYLCSKELRPSENEVYPFFYDEAVAKKQHAFPTNSWTHFIVHTSITTVYN